MKLRLAFIYVSVIYGLLFGLSQLSRIPVFQVVTREFTQSSNVFLNDLYFRLDHWGRDHETQVTWSTQVACLVRKQNSMRPENVDFEA